jgi:hypothetical protein
MPRVVQVYFKAFHQPLCNKKGFSMLQDGSSNGYSMMAGSANSPRMRSDEKIDSIVKILPQRIKKSVNRSRKREEKEETCSSPSRSCLFAVRDTNTSAQMKKNSFFFREMWNFFCTVKIIDFNRKLTFN